MGWKDETGHPLLVSEDKRKLEIQEMSINHDWDKFMDYINKGGYPDEYPGVELLYEMTTIDEVEVI
jgi:hypothetical protein